MNVFYKYLTESLRESSHYLDSYKNIINFHGLLKDQCSNLMYNAAVAIEDLIKKNEINGHDFFEQKIIRVNDGKGGFVDFLVENERQLELLDELKLYKFKQEKERRKEQ